MDPQYELPKLKASLQLGKLRYSSTTDPSEHGGVTLFDVKFYPYTVPGVDAVFAVCGGRNAIVYRCVSAQKPPIEVLAWFEDDALSCTCLPTTQECICSRLHALEWSQASNGDPLLCVAGARRQIRIFNVATKKLVSSFIGHGRGILDLAVSPTDPKILASCSDDRSLRIWSLDPRHQHQPIAAICYGQAHQDQVLTMAYHRNGRYILSGGMDSQVNLWVVPENIKEYAGTDRPKQIVYPHFSTTEVHVDFVDCIRWYGDLILSRAAREDKIVLWKIDGFNSENSAIPDPPIPTSNAVRSSTPVTVPANTTSNTRSAWGGRIQRLLEFEYPDVEHFYVRFSLFHEIGRHPLLVAGNSNFEAYFWDLQCLEESGTGSSAEISYTQDQQVHLHQKIGSDTFSSARSTPQPTKSAAKNQKKSKTKQDRAYGISNPFKPIPAHVLVPPRKEIKETQFRSFSWSRDGQWCVGVGEWAKIMVYQRWEKGVPPIRGDEQATLPLR